MAGIISLIPLPFFSVAIAINGTPSMQNIPLKRLDTTLRDLIEHGDYKSFLNYERTNSTSFRSVIAIDPVLKGTLEGLRDVKLHELIDNLVNLESDDEAIRGNLVKSILGRVAFLSERAGNDPAIRAQVSRTLAAQLFSLPLVSLPIRASVLLDLAEYLPAEDLPLLDDIVNRMLGMRPSEKSLLVIQIYSRLVKNSNVSLGAVVDRIKTHSQVLMRLDSNRKAFGELILQIAQRPNIDEKTIQYFKTNENNPEWKGNETLRKALDVIKSNPMYSKP